MKAFLALLVLVAVASAAVPPRKPGPLRWGIVAAGKISNDFIKSLKNYPLTDHKVVAIASRGLRRAQDYARRFNITRAYAGYENLAKDPEVDVVYIATINPYHLPVAKMMLNAGKPVLCEKPLTMNRKQTIELITLAERKNVFLMEALWSRFLPPYQFAMKKIAEGAIGEVVHVDARFTPYLATIPRLVTKSLGGGTILDLGGYAANTLLLGFNHTKPYQISATGVLNKEGVDVAVSASLLFPGGKVGTIMLDLRGTAPSEAMFLGTKGYIRLSHPFNAPETVTVNDVPYHFNLKDGTKGYNWENDSGLRFEAEEVRRCLQQNRTQSTIMSHQHSIMLSEIEDELRRQVGTRFDVD